MSYPIPEKRSVYTRLDELKAQGYPQERIKEILKEEYPDYTDSYFDDLIKTESEAKTKEKKVKPTQKVQVVGFDMPFGDMVVFMVKWAIAAIPAMIILFLIGFIVTAFLAAIGFAL